LLGLGHFSFFLGIFSLKYIALLSLIVKKWSLHISAVLFYRLIPSIFHQTLSKYTPKNSFKMWFFYMSRVKYVNFLVCKLPYFTCKNCLDWDIFQYFYFLTKYIALLSLIVKKWSLHISYSMKIISWLSVF
jgi:hypothetical protein